MVSKIWDAVLRLSLLRSVCFRILEKSCRAFSFNLSVQVWEESFLWELNVYLDRCILERFQLARCLCWSWCQRIFLEFSFWTIIIFVFFGLIFDIHVSQYEGNVLKQFCSPTVLDLNRMIKSSAYNSKFLFLCIWKNKWIRQRVFE